ncbi:MAG: DUF4956 domain-containing protein [Gammaproteobacteria bacterium]|nr:DUF4956 domain-containing protein [Gammaproteobacteria bacterium]
MTDEKALLDEDREHRWLLMKVIFRMTLYYASLAVLIALIQWIHPGFIDQLPLGGVVQIANSEGSPFELQGAAMNTSANDFEEIATRSRQTFFGEKPDWWTMARSLLYAMTCTLLLMIPVSWVYKSIHDSSVSDHSLDETTMVLPAVVAGIVIVVQHSLALAFSLAGIVAGVRFRRALSDTFDTLFIFVAIGVGIAAGIRSVEIALVLTVFFNYATIMVCAFGDGLESQFLARKKRRNRERKEAERAAQRPDVDNF